MEDKAQNIFNLYKENNLLEKVPENKHCQFAIIFDTKNEFILRGQRYFCRLDSFQLDPDISKWTRREGSPSWCWSCPLYRTGFSPANFRVKSIENVQNLLIPEQMNIYETLEQIDDNLGYKSTRGPLYTSTTKIELFSAQKDVLTEFDFVGVDMEGLDAMVIRAFSDKCQYGLSLLVNKECGHHKVDKPGHGYYQRIGKVNQCNFLCLVLI